MTKPSPVPGNSDTTAKLAPGEYRASYNLVTPGRPDGGATSTQRALIEHAEHVEGAEVVTVARPYAELAVQLAAALHNFLIAKHLERQPPAPPPPAPQPGFLSSLDDDIPF